ncbi:MAG TPA: response regulator [Microvirga sp.]
MRVVLVEDDPVCREIVEATLRREGHEVTSLETGEAAVALLDEEARPDLLLTDVQLEGDFDGWSLARLYQDEYPSLPVVYITAGQGETDPVNNSVYLKKPIDLKLLLRTVSVLART